MPIPAYGYLLSGTTVSGASDAMDCRYAFNYAYVHYAAAVSAVIRIDASFDATAWQPVLTVTATNTTGTAQVSAYYPYVRGVCTTAFSNGTGYLFYAPGLQRI